MDGAEAISKSLLFRDTPKEVVDRLAGIARDARLAHGAALFREGDAADSMYVIVLGSVRVTKRDKNGEDVEIATLGSGSAFGEMSIVRAEDRRAATIIAQEPTVALELRRESIAAACDESPSFAAHFYRALARGLAMRLRATTEDFAALRVSYTELARR